MRVMTHHHPWWTWVAGHSWGLSWQPSLLYSSQIWGKSKLNKSQHSSLWKLSKNFYWPFHFNWNIKKLWTFLYFDFFPKLQLHAEGHKSSICVQPPPPLCAMSLMLKVLSVSHLVTSQFKGVAFLLQISLTVLTGLYSHLGDSSNQILIMTFFMLCWNPHLPNFLLALICAEKKNRILNRLTLISLPSPECETSDQWGGK